MGISSTSNSPIHKKNAMSKTAYRTKIISAVMVRSIVGDNIVDISMLQRRVSTITGL